MIRNLAAQYDTETGRLYFWASNGDQIDLTAGLAAADINALISTACATDKAIGQAIMAAITAAIADGGAIDNRIDALIAANAGG